MNRIHRMAALARFAQLLRLSLILSIPSILSKRIFPWPKASGGGSRRNRVRSGATSSARSVAATRSKAPRRHKIAGRKTLRF